MITVNKNTASTIQLKVITCKEANRKASKVEKAYNLKWLLFPVACIVANMIAGIVGTLSLYIA